MNKQFSIQIFYPDGDPENVRMVSTKNWTGRILYISRDCWEISPEYKNKLETPGIYILAGKDDENNDDDIQSIYIGQAENLQTRIDQQIKDPSKLFFQNVICITGSEDFNNAHFRWMEAELIEKAKDTARCILKNGNAPNKPTISKPDEVDTKQFLDFALQILPAVEIKAFTEPKALPSISVPDPSPEKKKGLLIGKEILKKKILSTFQQRENVELRQSSRARFVDEKKETRICIIASKFHKNLKNLKGYWFHFQKNQKEFLEGGKQGQNFTLLGLEGNPHAIFLPLDKFLEIENKLPTIINDKRHLWDLKIVEENGQFVLKAKKGEEDFPIPDEYIVELEWNV